VKCFGFRFCFISLNSQHKFFLFFNHTCNVKICLKFRGNIADAASSQDLSLILSIFIIILISQPEPCRSPWSHDGLS
jgi:hypothetical protein